MPAKRMILLVASISLMTLWGCSSSLDSSGRNAEVSGEYATVGIDVCVQCHDIKGQEWLASRHGNAEPDLSPSSPHRPGESSCADCHNPLNDGDRIQQAFNTHEVRRDVIGCESCHGGGGLHYGLGPIEFPKPAPEICGECHNRDDNHHDTDISIYDRWLGSRHAESLHGEDELPCQRCHTNEGALAANVAAYTGDREVLGEENDLGRRAPMLIPEEEVTPVSCATCHDVHKAGQLRTVFDWDPNENGLNNDQFDLCTSCHVLFNDEGTLVGSGSVASGTAEFYHETSWFRIIGSTHYDDPATGPVSGDDPDATIIEGYNIRWKSANPCFDCHGHEARTATRPYAGDDPRDAPTIWTDWSSSAQAGHLFEKKLEAAADAGGVTDPGSAPRTTVVVDAVMAAGVDDPDDAWVHYNWDRSGRAGCQRCHTATGAMNFMNANATLTDDDDDNDSPYNQNNNDYSHLDGWAANPTNGSPQNEMLYCWACHKNAPDGILRNPGPITEEYDPVVIVEYPDINGSNVCMTCHLGRETGEVVKTKTGFDSESFVNSHYLAAGGTVFGTTGYHFSGRSYTIPASDTHDNIGLGDTGNAVVDADYTNGPCVTCHFGSVDRSHSLSPFTQYGENDLALNPVCVNCHTTRGQGTDAANTWFGRDFTIDDLVAGVVAPHRGRYIAALEALYEILADNGYYFQPRHPYFFNGPSASATAITNWTIGASANGMNNMGAAFNFNLLEHDPGGVAHNRRYTRRLIYDSIDYLDDGSLNYSVAATLNVLSDTTPYKASAISYLLQAQNGDAGDRY